VLRRQNVNTIHEILKRLTNHSKVETVLPLSKRFGALTLPTVFTVLSYNSSNILNSMNNINSSYAVNNIVNGATTVNAFTTVNLTPLT